jgi:predicted nucleic acid-binding protein
VTRYLLDTNIVSDLVKPQPSASLLAWISKQTDDDLFVGAVTVAEIERGLLEMPTGRKRLRLEAWFAGPDGPLSVFAGRILPFDERAGHVWAILMAEGKSRGRPRDALDMMLAAIAAAHGCVIVTDNERDFFGLNFINPMRATELP